MLVRVLRFTMLAKASTNVSVDPGGRRYVVGVSSLADGLTDYGTIVKLASKGIRDRIDLKVSHIYEGAEPPISGDLTASNFGRILNSLSKDEFTHESFWPR